MFLERLAHRGPDDLGWLALHREKIVQGQDVPQNSVAQLLLLHRRLSILDLSAGGHQPMLTPDGRYGIVFNGEIYNYLELREELETLGHRFHSRSDTEVLLVAFAQWGVQCLHRLVGMFACAILDRPARRLWLIRDFFGIKPLYYAFWQEGMAFASEIGPLLELPGVARSVNPRRLYDYLCSGITDHGAETMFASIKQIPPAHFLEIDLEQLEAVRPIRYWDIERADFPEHTERSFEQAAESLRELFLDTVRLHLRSDVPVGAALSGGIDSSAIVMAMRRLDPTLDIHTFSFIADDAAISEERWVDVVAGAASTHVHKVKLTSDELIADLDRLIEVQGEPFISTSMYAQYRVFQAAQQAGIKVMLDGQGADELFAGYPSYRLARVASLLRSGHWDHAVRLAHGGRVSTRGWNVFARALGRSAPTSVQRVLRRALRRETMPAWLNTNWFREQGVEPVPHRQQDGEELLKQELYQTLTETSLPQLLHYEDRNSMAFSIESRVPFLNPGIAQFVFALPERFILATNGTTKAIFRRAMRGIVPDVILDRRDKLGFPTPERQWLFSFRTSIEQVLKDPTASRISALDLPEIWKEWDAIMSQKRAVGSEVWRWINLILWTEHFSVQVD
jgi:asparagine synthase (glutamine-hydrolysing)